MLFRLICKYDGWLIGEWRWCLPSVCLFFCLLHNVWRWDRKWKRWESWSDCCCWHGSSSRAVQLQWQRMGRHRADVNWRLSAVSCEYVCVQLCNDDWTSDEMMLMNEMHWWPTARFPIDVQSIHCYSLRRIYFCSGKFEKNVKIQKSTLKCLNLR